MYITNNVQNTFTTKVRAGLYNVTTSNLGVFRVRRSTSGRWALIDNTGHLVGGFATLTDAVVHVSNLARAEYLANA